MTNLPKSIMDQASIPRAFLDENGNPTPQYQAYAQYRQAYQNSLEAYNTAYAAALENPAKLQLWPLQGKVFQQAVDAALNDWLAVGNKAEIEQKMNA
jgi:hypothetical protein